VGTLTAVSSNGWTWAPPADAAQILDSGDPAHGQVLRETQMGIDETTLLKFSPVTVGIIRIGFDARVSNPYVRTIDMSLDTTTGIQAGFVGWGVATNSYGTNSGQFAYYDGISWVGIFNLDTGWHHYEATNYLSGANAGKFDVAVDGALVGRLLPWRQAIAAQSQMGRLRIAAIRGGVMEYGDVDNLVITASAVTPVYQPITLLSPAWSSGAFSFRFQSQSGVSHLVQWKPAIQGGTWSDLTAVTGDGAVKTVTDTNVVSGRYYRVRNQ
jgi:hypothetical protein